MIATKQIHVLHSYIQLVLCWLLTVDETRRDECFTASCITSTHLTVILLQPKLVEMNIWTFFFFLSKFVFNKWTWNEFEWFVFFFFLTFRRQNEGDKVNTCSIWDMRKWGKIKNDLVLNWWLTLVWHFMRNIFLFFTRPNWHFTLALATINLNRLICHNYFQFFF